MHAMGGFILDCGKTAHKTVRGLMSVKVRQFVVMGLSALLTGMSIGVAPSASAAAEATCTHPSWSNKDSGVDSVRYALLEGAPIRTGPNEGCGVVGMADWNYYIYLHCYTINSAGHFWDHVRAYNRFTGDEISGWIYENNLDGIGSTKAC